MLKTILANGSAYASSLILWLIDTYGADALEFEPETVSEILKGIHDDVSISVINRVNAGLGLFSSDLFWTDPFTFGVVCRTLNKHKFPTANAPSMLDLAWGVTESNLLILDPADSNDQLSFSDSVKRFIQITAKSSGIFTMPYALRDIVTPSAELRIDDSEMYAARQAESDADAARIDAKIAENTIELFKQIKDLRLNITKDAAAEIDDIIGA